MFYESGQPARAVSGTIAAFVGATGGAGTTRLCLEAAGALARDGRDVAVLDAAYATQGLADHVPGELPVDVTALVTDDRPLADGLSELPVDAPGRIVCCPARAPFERFAAAKTPEAARRFEGLAREAAADHEFVLLDVPPVAANQAVAAATVADRVAVVTPGTARGDDAGVRMRDRLADLGVDADTVVATRTKGSDVADAAVPTDERAPSEIPVAATGDGAFSEAVVAATETVVGVSLDVTFESGLLDL